MSQIPEKILDVRARRHYLKRKQITATDVAAYSKSLSDDQDNFDLLSFDDESFLAEVGELPSGEESDADNDADLEENE